MTETRLIGDEVHNTIIMNPESFDKGMQEFEFEFDKMEEYYLNNAIYNEIFLPYFFISPFIYYGCVRPNIHDSIYSRKLTITKDAIIFEKNNTWKVVV